MEDLNGCQVLSVWRESRARVTGRKVGRVGGGGVDHKSPQKPYLPTPSPCLSDLERVPSHMEGTWAWFHAMGVSGGWLDVNEVRRGLGERAQSKS